ncbi:hypothetical protein O3P69_000842 [Scylla paramamosain]|uniref:Uncharacterized protein n=1 Tax=Scylla paramamosain TaxID=85552 RepID=A0AAW0URP4_SCYPA
MRSQSLASPHDHNFALGDLRGLMQAVVATAFSALKVLVADILTKMAIDPSLAETDIFDEVLKYGLFLGAIFQLVCIGAVMFVPSRDDRRDGDSMLTVKVVTQTVHMEIGGVEQ